MKLRFHSNLFRPLALFLNSSKESRISWFKSNGLHRRLASASQKAKKSLTRVLRRLISRSMMFNELGFDVVHFQAFFEHLNRSADRGHGISDLVGNPCSELADQSRTFHPFFIPLRFPSSESYPGKRGILPPSPPSGKRREKPST